MKRSKYNKKLNICPSNITKLTYRKNVIYVEGKNDMKIFESIVTPNWMVSIFGEGTNKTGKQCIIDYFKNYISDKQIAVVDRDYDDKEMIKNVYYTDYNDIETTAINLMDSNEIKKCLSLRKVYSDEEFYEGIFYPVLNLSVKFSNLWKYFHDNGIRKMYLFKSPNYVSYLNRIVDFNNMKIDYNELKRIYNELKENNNEKYNIDDVDFKDIMDKTTNGTSFSFRGHDFFRILQRYFKINNIDTYFMDDNLIENGFIKNSIEYDWIRKSKIYNDIKKSFADCFK